MLQKFLNQLIKGIPRANPRLPEEFLKNAEEHFESSSRGTSVGTHRGILEFPFLNTRNNFPRIYERYPGSIFGENGGGTTKGALEGLYKRALGDVFSGRL